MPSSFGWLDNDDDQRRRMLEVVDLFKEQSSVDELGIGVIRDTLSNTLFPGTSTLHTRLRYVLFIPWLMQEAASAHRGAAEARAQFRDFEYRLIDSLLAGGERLGVQGARAGNTLKRMPSDVYWSALTTWGIVDSSLSIESLFRRQADYQRLAERTAQTDDDAARVALPGRGIDSGLEPPPSGLLKATTFTLTAAEEDYLSTRIASSTRGSLLAWLVANPPGNIGDGGARYAWDLDNIADAPRDAADVLEHARRFSVVMHGASIAYNLGLARRSARDELEGDYVAKLAEWRDEGKAAAAQWELPAFWGLLDDKRARVRGLTRAFVEQWVAHVRESDAPGAGPDAERLVGNRERQLKGSRARFGNQSALDRWSGAAGMSPLEFRWPETASHLRDLYTARGIR